MNDIFNIILTILAVSIGFVTAQLHNKGYYKTGNCLFGGFLLGIVLWVAWRVIL